MRIDIIGAGALGLLFGGKLAEAGERVRFWTRTAEQAELLRREGVELTEPDGTIHIIEGKRFAADALEQTAGTDLAEEPDWLLLMTKQGHITEALLSACGRLAGKHTNIVCFQNGAGHLERIRQMIPGQVLYAAITTEGAKRADGRRITRAGFGETHVGVDQAMDFLEFSGESLVKLLRKAGFNAFLSNDIGKEMFRKLLINAVINPLTAIWRIPNGQLLESEARKAAMRQLCDEGERIFRANGIAYDADIYAQILEVCRSTAGNTSSMLKDVLAGNPTEIDFINGRLAEMARAKQVAAPGHELVWQLIRGMQPDMRIKI
ncbi:2-dehydropantoate 2-reductase [Paenibacillus macerans]|uniref:ketopantoate reductase family protein n=1 Tax=Paenibacillus macerans TaxID=44252 RepID=UPI002E1A8B3B|nr:2-dehydropantoate 2-reductase [Paenibacillus macerans]